MQAGPHDPQGELTAFLGPAGVGEPSLTVRAAGLATCESSFQRLLARWDVTFSALPCAGP